MDKEGRGRIESERQEDAWKWYLRLTTDSRDGSIVFWPSNLQSLSLPQK